MTEQPMFTTIVRAAERGLREISTELTRLVSGDDHDGDGLGRSDNLEITDWKAEGEGDILRRVEATVEMGAAKVRFEWSYTR